MIKPRLVILSAIGLAVAAAVLGPGAAAVRTEPDRSAAGRALFHRELKRQFLLHPRAFSLEAEDAERIMAAESRLPGLFDAVLRLVASGERIEPFAGTGPEAFERREWLALCREGADRFIQSLFLRDPPGPGAEAAGTPLDLVLASLGLAPLMTGSGSPARPAPAVPAASLEVERLLQAAGFGGVHRLSRGAGVRIDVIGPADPARTAGRAGGAAGNDDAAILDGEPLPYPALLAAAAAPESTIRFRPIHLVAGSTRLYWSAFQMSLAIDAAVRSGARVVVAAASFAVDYPFLRAACLRAYRVNVVVVCPAEPLEGTDPEVPFCFPAHYTTTLAVAGTVPGRDGAFAPSSAGGSHYNDLSGPGPAVGATGLCGGAAALIASLMPPAADELEGQYVQRIREILVKSAEARVLGAAHFDPRTGYGMLRAATAAGPELEAYRDRRRAIEEDYAKRMKQRAEAEKKAAEERAAAEARRRKRP